MNDDLKVEMINDELKGRYIGLCVTGGIAAIETPKIARMLRRYGAEVTAYVTPNANKFIGKASLEWATEKAVVEELSGLAEHICKEDLVLVAPATTNTINKMFYGIADNSVTTLLASALGKKVPVYIAPCMHISLYDNPILQENMKKAGNYGVKIIPPRFSESKAKIANTRTIIQEVRDYFKEKHK
jgi:phosphopantothenoylcysteine decarboxylase / phosphopantothenate---cysteine ligase